MQGPLLLECVCPVTSEVQRHSRLERARSHFGKLAIGPDISLIGVCPGEIKTHVHKEPFTRQIHSFFMIVNPDAHHQENG